MKMKSIAVTGYGLSKICRLCLACSVPMVDIFSFSYKLKCIIADLIMTCTPVQIVKHDDFPKFICRSCYIKLTRVYKLQKRAINSEKTLRLYVQQLHKPDCKWPAQRQFENSENRREQYECRSRKEEFFEDFKDPLSVQEPFEDLKDPLSVIKQEESSFSDQELLKESEDPNSSTEIVVECDVFEMSVEDGSEDTKICNKTEESNAEKLASFTIKKEENISELTDWSNIKVGNTETRLCVVDSNSECTSFVNKSSNKKSNNKKRYTRIYKCETCNKSFTQSHNLKSHKLLHAGEKPHQCDICHKCFTRLHDLKKHNLLHTGEKPFKCDVCNKCFKQAGHLSGHKLQHTGEKPHQCDVCFRSFTQLSHVKRHKLLHCSNGRKI